MEKAKISRWLCIMLILTLGLTIFLGCGSSDPQKDAAEREYQKRLKEARELAEKIQKGEIFDEETMVREKLLHPENICSMGADLSAVDFGPDPDFRGDGEAAIYADKTGTLYYYYFPSRQRFKLDSKSRNPSFGALKETQGDQKFIYEKFILRQNSWDGDSHGIMMNTEAKWQEDATQITDIPAQEPYLVDNDQLIVYHIDDKYYKLDDKMNPIQFSKEEYENLKNSRYSFENSWKIEKSYRGLSGVWLTDVEEKNWCQLRQVNNIKTVKLIPSTYNIYFWAEDDTGVLMVKPIELSRYTIQIDSPQQFKPGELFDVYEKEISPISNEIIGYKEDKFKGTLRVIDMVDDKLICEYQTRLHLEGIFAGDAAVARSNNTIIGKIL